jgi:subtilisin family serine protease
MPRRSGVDPFLSHVPDAKPDANLSGPSQGAKRVVRRYIQGAGSVDTSAWVPALVRVPHAEYKLPLSVHKEFKESSRLGNVLSGRGTKAMLQALGSLPGVTVEVSRDGGTWELDKSRQTVQASDVAAPEGHSVERLCLVGIIDGGIDPMHHAFLDRTGKTRILFVWDQTATIGNPPTQQGFDYGVLYTARQIDDSLAAGERLNVATNATEDELLHGTHVASIAAGRRTIGPDGQVVFSGGMAPDAPMVVVIPALRAGAGRRPSEGFAKSHVDALKFIDRVAASANLSAVVNVSAGIAAGAHDGTSTLEAGFDAFTSGGHALGRAVVKSAGNAHEAQRYRRFEVAQGLEVIVKLVPSLRGGGPATVEAWCSSADDVELTLTEGDRPASFTLSRRNPLGKLETKNGSAGLSYERFHRDNGDSLVLLSLPQTELAFELRFFGQSIRGRGTVDLWVEGELTVEQSTPQRTLTMPGSARTVITVASSNREGRTLAPSSSLGPTRDERLKPELYAPGEGVRAAKAGTDLGTIALSGTSMAAPHVTGAIALCFSKEARLGREVPNALQVRAALIATAKDMNGIWHEGRGYGLLNTRAFLEAFDESAAPDEGTAAAESE